MAIFRQSRLIDFAKIFCGQQSFQKKEDKYYKGSPRSYREANSLGVIDERIAVLVAALNVGNVVRTMGCCQGHGYPFISVSPYVAFKADFAFASALASFLRYDSESPQPKLRYFWELSARFDLDAELTYVLIVPGIVSQKWFYATGSGLDKDFDLLCSTIKKILDHLQGQDVKVEKQPDYAPRDDGCNHELELESVCGPFSSKRISRIASIATRGSRAQTFSTINTFIKRHISLKKLTKSNNLIVAWQEHKKELSDKFFWHRRPELSLWLSKPLAFGRSVAAPFKSSSRAKPC